MPSPDASNRLILATLVAMNVAGFAWIANRVASVESRMGQIGAEQAEASRERSAPGTTAVAPRLGPSANDSSRLASTSANVTLGRIKQPTTSVNAQERMRSLITAQSNEPKDPERERMLQQWLKQAAETIDENAPAAKNLQTYCQGQRCTISASFSNDGDASDWATRFLLSGGGKYLSRSQSVILPASDNSSAALQLYLF